MINTTFKNKQMSCAFFTLLMITASSHIFADDTEVFITSSSSINPNVLFIMDNSSSMSETIDGKPRIQIMKDALAAVLSAADDNLNVGITNYGSTDSWRNDRANGIKYPIKPLNSLVKPVIEESLKDRAGEIQWRQHRQPAPEGNGQSSGVNPVVDNFDTMTVRQYLPEVAKAWVADGNTPIVDALYEAAIYFRGDEIRWQDVAGYGGRAHYKAAAHPSTYRYSEGVYQESAAFPNHDFPYIPQWYADNFSSEWTARSTNEEGSFLNYYKRASVNFHSGWIKCVSNTGSPNYTPLKDSGPSKQSYCRTMRDDFVKYLQRDFWNVLTPAVNDINAGRAIGVVDYRIRQTIRQVSTAQLQDKATSVVEKLGLKVFQFSQFPRCRVIEEVVCTPGAGNVSTVVAREKYKCKTDDSEACRAWDYEQCKDPADRRIVNEVVCDFDQNLSRYPAPNYTSPIVGDCQSNYIVLMSDGKPEYSDGDRKSLKTYSGTVRTNVPDLIGESCVDDPYFVAGTCGPELTNFLATTDNLPGTEGAAAGDQFINTLVIGFSEGITAEAGATEYLSSLVTVVDQPETDEKEGFFIATDEAELVKAFTDALKEIAVTARSQASPGYSVNVKSGLEHENEVYIPIFDKKNSSAWAGNLKKFKLIDIDGHRHIRGKTTGVDAMTELGLFKEEAWDLWSESATADGNSVQKGGVASLLTKPDKRKLYSNLTGNTNVSLWETENHLSPTNNNITNAMVGESGTVNSPQYRKRLLRFVLGWKRGLRGKGARKHMGDMLHSEPVIVTYEKEGADGNGSAKEQYIFVATNEGYLHAFDTDTGEEKFAFMPKQLLKNIQRQFVGTGEHVYGIDGAITYLKSGDNVYLYFGLRRGGKAYYALDVTDINKPKLMWKIDGETNAHFSHLGQSWSTPYITNVMHDGHKKTAIVFTGGNDTKFDYGSGSTYTESTVTDEKFADTANDIYIVNAKTGDLLWSMRDTMQRSDVKHAIPGGVRILDVNNNGLLDRFYFADTGGNVWRLDLHEELTGSPSKSKLVKIAALAGSDSERRKFYNEPDVAQLTDNGNLIFTVSVGSGIRPHPINKRIKDHMFILLDKSPLNELKETGEDKYKTIKITDLANVEIEAVVNGQSQGIVKTLTHTGFTKDTKDVNKITQTNKKGWYVKFPDDGEKVLAPSITFEGTIIFTTLVPSAITSGDLISVCESPGTQGRLYAMNILTGEASIDMNRDESENDNDVFSVISANEIPGKPQRIFNALNCSDGSCKHEVDIRIGKKNSEVGIKDVSNVESIYWNAPHPSIENLSK